MLKSVILAFAATAILAACSSRGPSRQQLKQIDRVLERAPGAAQPSTIVATEIAFSRAAMEQGQWTAFRQFAAEGALLHQPGGLIDAKPWLVGQRDPERPRQWTPLAVWMSCDGGSAISQGKYRDQQGQWGYYATVWQQQRDRSYLYTYDLAGEDAALTARENRMRGPIAEGENVIVVTALSSVRGEVADCAKDDARFGATPLAGTGSSRMSGDGTLAWSAQNLEDGRRVFRSQYWQNGAWREALEMEVGADGSALPYTPREAASPPTITVARSPAAAVLAADRAMSAASGEIGAWQALANNALPGAVLFDPQPVDAGKWLAGRAGSDTDFSWEPSKVLLSCDERMAVTSGAIDWGETSGFYTTLWQNVSRSGAVDGWRWVASHGNALDTPLPVPALAVEETASCEGTPGVPLSAPAEGVAMRQIVAPDQTLIFGWEVAPDGARVVTTKLWNGSAHETALAEQVGAPPVNTAR